MCNNEQRPTSCNCIAEILKVIAILQKNAEKRDNILDSCDRGFLGCGSGVYTLNTRPVMLYLGSNNVPWEMPICKDNNVTQNAVATSNVFRVEKVDDCCATFRVLAPNPNTDETCISPYVATNSFFTVNLDCVCCIRCLSDVYVDCV